MEMLPGARSFASLTQLAEEEELEMQKTPRTKAEEQFAAIQKKHKKHLMEKEKEQEEKAAHTARLRKMRLQKEADEKKANAEKPISGIKKPLGLPQAHRR